MPMLCGALLTSLKQDLCLLSRIHVLRACLTGCQPCPDSPFVNHCEGCTVNGCQASCNSCLDSNRTAGPPVSVTIPAGGCVVYKVDATSDIICLPGTEGTCPLGEHSVVQHGIACGQPVAQPCKL